MRLSARTCDIRPSAPSSGCGIASFLGTQIDRLQPVLLKQHADALLLIRQPTQAFVPETGPSAIVPAARSVPGPDIADNCIVGSPLPNAIRPRREAPVRPGRVHRVHRRGARVYRTWTADRPSGYGFGELVQWDSSEHDWLEGRGLVRYLVRMIDDATSWSWGRFVEQDATPHNMGVLWEYLEKNGRMVDVYTDRDSMFTVPPRPGESREAQRAADRLTSSGGRCENWESVQFWPIRRKRKGGSSGAFSRLKIDW